jgi:hypothetical protein
MNLSNNILSFVHQSGTGFSTLSNSPHDKRETNSSTEKLIQIKKKFKEQNIFFPLTKEFREVNEKKISS